MSTFNGDRALKAQYLSRAAHMSVRSKKEDRKQLYFSNNCWCEAGYVCQRQDCQHRFYAEEIGVPVALAYTERALYLNLPKDDVPYWPRRFIDALPVGMSKSGLERVCREFALYLLTDPVVGLYSYAFTPQHYQAIAAVIELYRTGSNDAAAWEEAAKAAHRASHVESCRSSYSVEGYHKAGGQACSAAGYLASAHSDPRRFADAVSWAPWAERYKCFAQLMGEVNDRPYAHIRCERAGEERRQFYYHLHGEKLLKLIAAQARREGFGPLGWLTTRLAKLLPAGPTGDVMRSA
ncbi:MAG: hypothetical protein IPP57_09305 [Candidatus Obscuribacter sp.]|jgi:hypothetical protein|nr:hypothetical protein [Candidatus Obscuribacter sp.]